MAEQRVEMAITMIAADDGRLGIDYSGVRITTDGLGVETVEQLTMHETMGMALRAIHMWHITEHQKSAPKGPQILAASGALPDMRT